MNWSASVMPRLYELTQAAVIFRIASYIYCCVVIGCVITITLVVKNGAGVAIEHLLVVNNSEKYGSG